MMMADDKNHEDKNHEETTTGSYRTERGVTVGFREEESREFFETRLLTRYNEELGQFLWTSIPRFPPADEFDSTVREIYSVLHRVGIEVLVSVAHLLQIDPQFLLDLTDLQHLSALDEHAVHDEEIGYVTDGIDDAPMTELLRKFTYSSTLLRICKYAVEQNAAADATKAEPHQAPRRPIAFGAHTDSSFITVALLASVPGLEIVDQHSNNWVCPEAMEKGGPIHSYDKESNLYTFKAVVFVGEFLQVLTGGFFSAAVHRVACGPRTQPRYVCTQDLLSMETECDRDTGVAAVGTDAARVSCPMIIRGRNSALIDFNGSKYSHPFRDAVVSPEKGQCENSALSAAQTKLSSFDGINMKLFHSLLELKRKRCFHRYGSGSSTGDSEVVDGDEGGEWVLSAFPVPPLPCEHEGN